MTGLIYIDEKSADFHAMNNTSEGPLNNVPYAKLTPGRKGMEKIMGRYR